MHCSRSFLEDLVQRGEEHCVKDVQPPTGVSKSPVLRDPQPLSERSSPELSLGEGKGKAALVAQYEEAISSGRCPLKVEAVTVKQYRRHQRQVDTAKACRQV